MTAGAAFPKVPPLVALQQLKTQPTAADAEASPRSGRQPASEAAMLGLGDSTQRSIFEHMVEVQDKVSHMVSSRCALLQLVPFKAQRSGKG